MDRQEIARRLVRARGEMSQKEAADLIGVSRSTLSMYEIGSRIPKDEIKIQIAKVYKVSVQELFY